MIVRRPWGLWAVGVAVTLGMQAHVMAASLHPVARPSHNSAYSTYADYYVRHYADLKGKKATGNDPYRYFNLYGYYRSRYGSGASAIDANPYYYFGLYESQRRERYLQAHAPTESPKQPMLEAAMRFWKPPAPRAADTRKDSHGR